MVPAIWSFVADNHEVTGFVGRKTVLGLPTNTFAAPGLHGMIRFLLKIAGV